jgi:hypothetical protein
MKTIIKLAIAAVVLTGCFNVGRALVKEYQFEDAVHEALLFDPRMTDKEIIELVMRSAGEHSIPLDQKEISIRQTGPDVRVDMSYTQSIVVIPGVFSKEWTFNPSASTRLLVGNRRQPS